MSSFVLLFLLSAVVFTSAKRISNFKQSNPQSRVKEIRKTIDIKEVLRNNEKIPSSQYSKFGSDESSSVPQAGSMSSAPLFPYCSDVVLKNGFLDFQSMFNNCTVNAPTALFIPSYYTKHSTNVSVQFAFDNLIQVDDYNNEITFDFYFRLTWNDPRLVLPPEMYNNYLPPSSVYDGIIVEQFGFKNYFWTPDITFIDAVELSVQAEVIKWRPNGTIYWSRHMILSLQQPQMNFSDYPQDTQAFSIRFQSFGNTANLLALTFINPSYTFVANADLCNEDNPEGYSLKSNQLWSFVDTNTYISVDYQPTSYYPGRAYYIGYMNLKFKRQANGIMFRLVLPVLMLLIIVGVSFYVNIELQIDVALNMLLVVAALYLVIGSTIPFVGYLSRMDKYITATFTLLGSTLFVYFISVKLELTHEKYPLRLFIKMLMLQILKFLWMPIIFLVFYLCFQSESIQNDQFYSTIAAILITASTLEAVRSFSELQEKLKEAILRLRAKRSKYNEMVQDHDPLAVDVNFLEKLFLRLTKNKWNKNMDLLVVENGKVTQLKNSNIGDDKSNYSGSTTMNTNNDTSSVRSLEMHSLFQNTQNTSVDSQGSSKTAPLRSTKDSRHSSSHSLPASNSINPLVISQSQNSKTQDPQHRLKSKKDDSDDEDD